jgi:hypothetical protein
MISNPDGPRWQECLGHWAGDDHPPIVASLPRLTGVAAACCRRLSWHIVTGLALENPRSRLPDGAFRTIVALILRLAGSDKVLAGPPIP